MPHLEQICSPTFVAISMGKLEVRLLIPAAGSARNDMVEARPAAFPDRAVRDVETALGHRLSAKGAATVLLRP